jgi:hypothetical protein
MEYALQSNIRNLSYVGKMTINNSYFIKRKTAKTRNRSLAFSLMLEHLSFFKYPLIVETGCSRDKEWNGFEGDGQATDIFDEYVNTYGGEFHSVDISQENVDTCLKHVKRANMHCEDSVSFLYRQGKIWKEQGRKIDLLYLDSFDFDPKNMHPSSLHHIFELTAIMPCLSEGSMIVVDDHYGDVGKGMYIDQFMNHISKKKALKRTQWIWIL